MLTSLTAGLRWFTNTYAFLDEARERQGLTFELSLPGLGKSLVTGEPALIGEIIRSRDLTGGKGITALRAIFGDGSLIMLTGEAHRDRRRLVSPQFRAPRIVGYDLFTVEIARQIIDSLPYNQPFAIYDVVRRISLRAIIRAIFGPKPPTEAEYAETLIDAFLESFQNPLVLFLRPLHLDLGRYSPWGRAMRNRSRLEAYIRSEIASCSQHPGQTDSILGRLVEGSCPAQLDPAALVAEILALLMFGHDTGAAAMAWAFAHIYQDPAVVERIRAEIRQSTGLAPEAYPYLSACLNESMRLCPVVAHLIRVADQDTQVGPYRVAAGQTVIPCTYLAQRNPAIYPAPDQFRPERFLEVTPDPMAFFPFGFGYRTCVGKRFVWRQMVLILAAIIGQVDLALAPGYRVEPVRQMVLIGPKSGTLMVRTG